MAITIRPEREASIEAGNELPDISPDCELSVFVVFTSINWTMKALERARDIARPLGANIVVVAVQVVPFPLQLDEPPVPMEFVIRRFEEMADGFPEKTRVSAYLCRNPLEAFKRILNPKSPVVIGVENKWFPGRDERLARRLSRAGYDVTLVKSE